MFPVASIVSAVHRRPGSGAALSNDTSLSVFTIDGNPVTNGGTVNLANGTTNVTVVATANHPSATVGPITGDTGLSTGDNTLEFDVTAEDGVTVEHYSVTLDVAGVMPDYVSDADCRSVAHPNTASNQAYAEDQNTFAISPANPGVWSGDPALAFTYSWRVDGVEVGTGPTSPTWDMADLGKAASVVITGTNSEGSADFEQSLGIITEYV